MDTPIHQIEVVEPFVSSRTRLEELIPLFIHRTKVFADEYGQHYYVDRNGGTLSVEVRLGRSQMALADLKDVFAAIDRLEVTLPESAEKYREKLRTLMDNQLAFDIVHKSIDFALELQKYLKLLADTDTVAVGWKGYEGHHDYLELFGEDSEYAKRNAAPQTAFAPVASASVFELH